MRFRNLCPTLAIFGMLTISAMQTVWAEQPAADSPFVLRANGDVDEELFLVSALEDAYAGWPSPEQAAKSADWLAQTQRHIQYLRSIINQHRLHSDVAQLYDRCLQLLSAYQQYAMNVGAIS